MTWTERAVGVGVVGVVVAMAPASSHAAACCVGATSALPTRVGECEKVVAAVSILHEETVGWWDDVGQLATAEGYTEEAWIGNLGVGVRLAREWELAARLPIRHNHLAAGALDSVGSGLGDTRVMALWDPTHEKPRGVVGAGPTPVAIAGLRLPTGRDWTDSDDPLNADVTGLEHAAVVVGGQLERTLGAWPWSAGAMGEVDIRWEGRRTGVLVGNASFGRYFGSGWTALGTATHTLGQADASGESRATHKTAAGARVVRGRPLQWRMWAAAELDLPVAALGRAAPRSQSIGLGYAHVW